MALPSQKGRLMDILGRLLSGGGLQATYGPTDDWWYQPVGQTTTTGMRVTAESAQTVSAWFRGRDILATTLAMLPLGMYERLPDNQGRDSATDLPLHDVIHRKPNPWQDSFQWRRQAMYHLVDHGNSYHQIKQAYRNFAGEFWPIDPTCVKPELVTTTGERIYHIRDPKSGTTRTFHSDQIFHLMGASDDGISGKGILSKARQSIGLALAVEGYAATIFGRGALHGGVVTTPGLLNKEASSRMAASIKDATAGSANWHMPFVLEQGATWVQNTMTPEDAQMLLSRKFSVNDLARWLGLPPHMLGDLEKSSFSNIEHQGQEFVTYAEGPWLSLWEFAINDQLVLKPQTYYAEFNRDALVRGDLAARWTAYVQAVQTGVLTRNEVRVFENKKALPGLDEPLNPVNITGSPAPTPAPKRNEDSSKAEAIVHQSAARVLRKEISAIQKLAVRHAADADAFAVAVTDFYAKHVELVSETLQFEQAYAAEYCASQSAQVLAVGVVALEQWATDAYVSGLAGLALEGEAA